MALHRAAAPLRPDARLSDQAAEQTRLALQRVVRRWQQLPLDHALRASGGVRALAQALADETAETCLQRAEPGAERAEAEGRPPRIPDLGPATALDQLRVTVYDAQQAGLDRDLPERLTRLLHDIG